MPLIFPGCKQPALPRGIRLAPGPKKLQLARIFNLAPFLDGGRLVALSAGPDSQLYAAIDLNELHYRTKGPGATSAKTRQASPQSYRVLAILDGEVTLDVRIERKPFNIHFVQPLPNKELLLVCCRCRPDGTEKNGRVYSSEGQFVREMLLGDGIQSVQTTSHGTICTSYFDEGVFGDAETAHSGLVAWDLQGTRQYAFQSTAGLDSICDCYALNVDTERSTWRYYYTEFPLVQARDQRIVSHLGDAAAREQSVRRLQWTGIICRRIRHASRVSLV